MITGIVYIISRLRLLLIIQDIDTGTMSFIIIGIITGAGILFNSSIVLKLINSLLSLISTIKLLKYLITALNIMIQLYNQESGYRALCTRVLPACFILISVTAVSSDPDLDLDLVLPSIINIRNFSGRVNQYRRGSSISGKVDIF